jgi:hypothetical protein
VQALRYAQDIARTQGTYLSPSWSLPPSSFVWGYTPIWEIPRTLWTLLQIQQSLPAQQVLSEEARLRWDGWVMSWLLPVGISLLVLCWKFRKKTWQGLGFLATLLPFLLMLSGARTGLMQPRFISLGMAFLPVLLGLALGELIGENQRLRWGMVLLLLLLLYGPLHPNAPWRMAIPAEEEPMQSLKAFPQPPAMGAENLCLEGLKWDAEEGIGPGSKLFLMPDEERQDPF